MNSHRLLLVEDDPSDQWVVRRLVAAVGGEWQLDVVSSALEARHFLEDDETKGETREIPLPAAVFIDLRLPGITGIEFLQWIASQTRLSAVVRIVLTGSHSPHDMQMARERGAHAFLLKPLEATDLDAMLSVILARRNLPPELGSR